MAPCMIPCCTAHRHLLCHGLCKSPLLMSGTQPRYLLPFDSLCRCHTRWTPNVCMNGPRTQYLTPLGAVTAGFSFTLLQVAAEAALPGHHQAAQEAPVNHLPCTFCCRMGLTVACTARTSGMSSGAEQGRTKLAYS